MQKNQLFLLVTTLFLAFNVQAAWVLDDTVSTVSVVSIKKNTVGEVHYFKNLTGSILDNGTAQLSIDLNSVETNIAVRNERMKSLLFETTVFPVALVSLNFVNKPLGNIALGSRQVFPIEATLSLHGVMKKIKTTIQIVGVMDNGLLVSTVQPILLNTSDFGLASGIQALMEVANLPSISRVVPVSFDLIFKKQ